MGADRARTGEREGRPTAARPDGRLVWINAASLGEVQAALAVACRIGATVLITTTTATGAARAAAGLPKGGLHQFAPLDTPQSIARFVDHWRPDLAIFVESDLPLRAIRLLETRGVPMAWVNVRPSRTRARFPAIFAALLDRMAVVAPQDAATLAELRALGLEPERAVGPVDLKAHAPPPLADPRALAALTAEIGARPVWLALSVHPEEASLVSDAARRVRAEVPGALLILAPRHPEAADRIARHFDGLEIARRGRADPVGDADVYLADTTGETGTLLATASFAVIGGTFAEIGGHSPREAAQAGRPVIHGPFPGAHEAAFRSLGGGALRAEGADALARAVVGWLRGEGLDAARAALPQPPDPAEVDALVARLAALLP